MQVVQYDDTWQTTRVDRAVVGDRGRSSSSRRALGGNVGEVVTQLAARLVINLKHGNAIGGCFNTRSGDAYITNEQPEVNTVLRVHFARPPIS